MTLIFNLTVLWIFSSSTYLFSCFSSPSSELTSEPSEKPKSNLGTAHSAGIQWLRSVYLEITSYLCTPKLSPRVRLWFLAGRSSSSSSRCPLLLLPAIGVTIFSFCLHPLSLFLHQGLYLQGFLSPSSAKKEQMLGGKKKNQQCLL